MGTWFVSRRVRAYLDSLGGALQVKYHRPAYSPELNPVAYLFGHLKPHKLGNFCPQSFGHLCAVTCRRLRAMQRRPTLVSVFWKQADCRLVRECFLWHCFVEPVPYRNTYSRHSGTRTAQGAMRRAGVRVWLLPAP